MMISYNPLLHWMLENKVKKGVLVDELGLSWSTVNKLNNGENLELQIIERICKHFGLRIEQVVEIR